MRVFTKYILRSIKKSPIQPLLILLTLTVAVATIISSAKIMIQLDREKRHTDAINYNYDLSVTSSAQSDIGILIPDEIERVIGDGGEVIGEFHFRGYAPDLEIDGLFEMCAVDLAAADEFYGFRFKEYGEIRESTLKSSIILSSLAKEELGLDIGDEITVEILDETFIFTVAAIALPDGPMRYNHGIVDISAISDALKRANPSIAHMAEDFQPANRVRIRLNDPSTDTYYRDLLLSDPALSHVDVSMSKDTKERDSFASGIWLLFTMLVIFVVILISVIIIATSEGLLAAERRTSTALFMLCGAEPKQLSLIAYLEALIYAFLASGLGLALSIPMSSFVNTIFKWDYSELTFEPTDIIIAVLSAPTVALISTFINNKRTRASTVSELLSEGRERKRAKNGIFTAIAWGVLTLAAVTVAFCLDPRQRYVPAIVALVGFVLFSYFALPRIVAEICKLLGDLMTRLNKIPPKLYLSVRAISTSHPLMHSVRILTVLLSLLLSISLCLITGRKEINTIDRLFDCDHVGKNIAEEDDGAIAKKDIIETVYRMNMFGDTACEGGDALLGVSVEPSGYPYLNENMRPSKIIEVGEIAISHGLAAKYNKRVGDDFIIAYNSDRYSLRIAEILNVSSNLVFFDASSINASNSFVCMRMTPDVTAEQIGKLTSELEAQGYVLSTLDTITEPAIRKVSSFVSIMGAVVIAAFVSVIIGVVNLMLSVFRERRHERELYFTVGMTRGEIAASVTAEVLTMGAICLVLIPVFALMSSLIINMAANSFGFDVIH